VYEYKPYGTYHKVKLNNNCWPGKWIALTESPVNKAIFESVISYLNIETEVEIDE
jgi:hypothetical protein